MNNESFELFYVFVIINEIYFGVSWSLPSFSTKDIF